MRAYRKNIAAIFSAALLISLLLFFIFLLGKSSSDFISIIYIPKTTDESNDFWTSVVAGAEMAAKENGASLEIMSPNDEADVEGQKRLIMEAASKHPNAIVISASSSTALTSELQYVLEQGIKLVFVDSTTDDGFDSIVVATDNIAAGEKMVLPMLDSLTKESRIGIVNHVKSVSTAIEREQGFRKGLGKYESQIVDVVYSNSEYDTGYEVTKKLLEERPDIDHLACLNEYSAVGAARAVKEMGLTEEICVVGFDNSTEEIRLLEEGVFEAIVVQRAFSMGYLGIEYAVKDVKGEVTEHLVDSGSVLITKENMYEEANQELLFPFYNQE